MSEDGNFIQVAEKVEVYLKPGVPPMWALRVNDYAFILDDESFRAFWGQLNHLLGAD